MMVLIMTNIAVVYYYFFHIKRTTIFVQVLEKYHGLIKMDPMKWINKISSRNDSHIHVRINEAWWVSPQWFFLYQQTWLTDKCKIPCTFHKPIDEQDEKRAHQFNPDGPDEVYDAILFHDADCQLSSDRDKLQAKTRKRNDLKSTQTIFASIRLESDAVNGFSSCSMHHDADRFTTSPIDITLSYHRNSTIWVTYCEDPFDYSKITRYNVSDPPSKRKQYHAACAFISNCSSRHRMDLMLALLSHNVPIRSYGSCLRNVYSSSNNKIQELSKCKMSLSLENQIVEDYVTEKFDQGFQADTLTIYLGSPHIQDFSPAPHSFINAADFENAQSLAQYLLQVLNNDTIYNQYFEWHRTGTSDDFSNAFRDRYMHNTYTSGCKLCKAVAEMKLARSMLREMGLDVRTGEYKVDKERMKRLLQQENIEHAYELLAWQLYDVAYGRYWRLNNHHSDWNMIENVMRN